VTATCPGEAGEVDGAAANGEHDQDPATRATHTRAVKHDISGFAAVIAGRAGCRRWDVGAAPPLTLGAIGSAARSRCGGLGRTPIGYVICNLSFEIMDDSLHSCGELVAL
jgi:cytochrome c1